MNGTMFRFHVYMNRYPIPHIQYGNIPISDSTPHPHPTPCLSRGCSADGPGAGFGGGKIPYTDIPTSDTGYWIYIYIYMYIFIYTYFGDKSVHLVARSANSSNEKKHPSCKSSCCGTHYTSLHIFINI